MATSRAPRIAAHPRVAILRGVHVPRSSHTRENLPNMPFLRSVNLWAFYTKEFCLVKPSKTPASEDGFWPLQCRLMMSAVPIDGVHRHFRGMASIYSKHGVHQPPGCGERGTGAKERAVRWVILEAAWPCCSGPQKMVPRRIGPALACGDANFRRRSSAGSTMSFSACMQARPRGQNARADVSGPLSLDRNVPSSLGDPLSPNPALRARHPFVRKFWP